MASVFSGYIQNPFWNIDRVGAGLVTGPDHTTGHAVFRIRRLSPAASFRREVQWYKKTVSFQRGIVEGCVQSRVP